MGRHVNPTDPARTATAPYNFVPLPNRVFVVENGIEVNGKKIRPWKMHDQFVYGARTGWIDLEITTLTPLFIRGGIIEKGGVWDKRDARLRPEPFTSSNGRPTIPGSSLRGMLRTLVEILSFSKIKPVTDEKPFFRTVAADRVGNAYRNRMVRGNNKPIGGYLRRRGNEWTIVTAAEVLRVHRDELNNQLKLKIPARPDPKYFPDWNGQHTTCWFQRDIQKNWRVKKISPVRKGGWEEGTLVLTGSAPKKKYDFVFVGEDTGKSISIPEVLWRRFHDDDQLTQWQEKAFPKDKPSRGCRKSKGYLRDGEPVFFLADDSAKTDENPAGLVFFGRAQMFRFPYDLSPWDLLPVEVRNAGLDMAEALFGMVGQTKNKKDQAIKGRVFFEDAIATSGGPEWFEEIIVPRILASPKVTCFQHYLTQDGSKGQKDLTTYLNDDHTTVRGHKLYWHKWDGQGLEAVKESNSHSELLNDLQSGNPNDTQHTVIRPVKAGVAFKGRIRFDNLADMELGALLSALALQEGCVHRLGMGKALGLGSIKIEWKLHLADRAARYTCWENPGVTEKDGGEFITVFEKAMIEHARNTWEPIDENMSGLKRIGRLQAIFHLLQWTGKPPFSATEYMELQKFKSRPVLPTPHKVIGQEEPNWKSDPPRPSQEETASAPTGGTKPDPAIALTPPPPQVAKPVEKGQIRTGELKQKSGQWVALFEGDPREAVIVNQNRIDPGTAEGCVAEFYITEQSKKAGIKARFEKFV